MISLKQKIKHLLAVWGYELRKVKYSSGRVDAGGCYTSIFPFATYAPWLNDNDFLNVFKTILPNTLVDQYRCYELWDLVGQLEHVPGDLIEIGVWRGGTGTLIAYRSGTLPGKRTVYLCDTFSGVVKASDKDSTYIGGEHADTSEIQVRQLLSVFDLSNAVILTGIFPDDVEKTVENKTFCFVHIDVDVYQSAKEVFDFIWPKVSVGGIVVFDDYGFVTCDGIPRLVSEYRFQPGKLVIHNLNGHALIIKTA